MKRSLPFSPLMALIDTLRFTGLSAEQELLATLAAQNPNAAPSVRLNAKSLLLLNEGATVAEVAQRLSVSHRLITSLITRFKIGGFCHAVLGTNSSQAGRIWLSLSPASPPQLMLLRGSRWRKCVIDTATPSATSNITVIADPLSPTRQACCLKTDVHQADPLHRGGQERTTLHA
jgi:hypothetical protein